jgi:hypothetical protein
MKQMMRWVVVSVVVLLAALRPAVATTLVLNPPSGTADGVLQDIGPDGDFDSAVTTDSFMSVGGPIGSFPRQAAVVEFHVTAIPPGAHIISARLYLDDTGGGLREHQILQVFMYAGDGQVTVADATAPGVLVGTKTNLDSTGSGGPDPADLDLSITPSLVESLLSGGATHIGFLITPDRVLSGGSHDFFASSESTFPGDLAPRLTVEYAIDSDNDGIPDDEDTTCPDSDLSATVVIDGCDSEVPNTVFPSGCTISDLIAACAEGASNHGQFVSCVSQVTNDLKKAGTITGQQKDAIQSCAEQADIP